MTITILSPHRDDAAFSLGLTIEEWLDAGHRIEVVNCFTRSRYMPSGDEVIASSSDRESYVTALRQREDERWSRQYKPAVSLVDLSLADAPERLGCGIDDVCRTLVAPDDVAIAVIRSALRARAPQALVLPLAIGNHVDHLTALLAAQEGWGENMPLAFYEDLPYAARPGEAQGVPARAHDMARGLQPWYEGGKREVETSIARKRALTLCYGSQIDPVMTEQIAGFCERYGGRERLWVNAAWREAGLAEAN